MSTEHQQYSPENQLEIIRQHAGADMKDNRPIWDSFRLSSSAIADLNAYDSFTQLTRLECLYNLGVTKRSI
jgi:hypothetical protein